MSLKRLTSVAETAPKASATPKPRFKLNGDLVKEFNLATAKAKEATAKAGVARVDLIDEGLDFIFNHNYTAPTVVKTIEIEDSEGAVCRLTSQDKYSAVDPAAVEQLFEEIHADINLYMQETVIPSFNGKIFNAGDEGKFDKRVYEAYAKAIETVTTQLIARGFLPAGTNSPLYTSKMVLPLTTFDEQRWKTFTPAVNRRISEVVKNTVTITPE